MGNSKNICVVGAGILGLASSLLLTDAGHKVTIVARDHPGDKNTNWASPWYAIS
jgi:glycine/D-amino acid oxidase-like deaminating enzyme